MSMTKETARILEELVVDIVIRHGNESDLTAAECDAPRVIYLEDTKEFCVSRGNGTYENVTREIKENKSLYDVLKSRLDNLASLGEGSTTGDAELTDIRVGANGKTYPSAGEAVRGQVSELKEDLGGIETDLEEIANLNDCVKIRGVNILNSILIENKKFIDVAIDSPNGSYEYVAIFNHCLMDDIKMRMC